MDHLVDVEGREGRPRARCSCGWAGRARLREADAVTDARAHIERVGSGRVLAQSRRAHAARGRHAEGRCSDCGQVFEGEEWRCPACRELRGEQERRKGEELVAAGICRKCRRRPAAPNRTRCDDCLEKARMARQRWRERQREGAGLRVETTPGSGRNEEAGASPVPSPGPGPASTPPFTCRRCGGLSLPPRRNSPRPADICTPCWPREPEYRERRNARARERHRARYADDSEYRRQHRAASREGGRRQRRDRRAREAVSCRLCGEAVLPPRRNSLRAPDVCSACWPSTPEYREQQNARQRARYASDPEYRERLKARSQRRDLQQRAQRTPEQRESKNAYMREYMRQRRASRE